MDDEKCMQCVVVTSGKIVNENCHHQQAVNTYSLRPKKSELV